MEAKVETRHDDESPESLRDEDGQLWRVAADALDGTLAVEAVDDYGGGRVVPALADREPGRCSVARWRSDDTLILFPVRDYGENHTDPARYTAGSDEWFASRQGWREVAQ